MNQKISADYINRLKEFSRNRKGKTNGEFAKELGISKTTVNTYYKIFKAKNEIEKLFLEEGKISSSQIAKIVGCSRQLVDRQIQKLRHKHKGIKSLPANTIAKKVECNNSTTANNFKQSKAEKETEITMHKVNKLRDYSRNPDRPSTQDIADELSCDVNTVLKYFVLFNSVRRHHVDKLSSEQVNKLREYAKNPHRPIIITIAQEMKCSTAIVHGYFMQFNAVHRYKDESLISRIKKYKGDKQGKTNRQIAEEIGCSVSFVQKYFYNPRICNRAISSESQSLLKSLLIENPNMTHQEIAAAVGCGLSTVYNFAKKWNIPTRRRTRFNPSQLKELEEFVSNPHCPVPEMAEKLNCNVATIYRRVKYTNITKPASRSLSYDKVMKLREFSMDKRGLTLHKIAEEVGCSVSTAQTHLKMYRLERERDNLIALANCKTNKAVNEDSSDYTNQSKNSIREKIKSAFNCSDVDLNS